MKKDTLESFVKNCVHQNAWIPALRKQENVLHVLMVTGDPHALMSVLPAVLAMSVTSQMGAVPVNLDTEVKPAHKVKISAFVILLLYYKK